MSHAAHRSVQVQTEHRDNSTEPRRGGMLQECPRRVGLPFWLLRVSSTPITNLLSLQASSLQTWF